MSLSLESMYYYHIPILQTGKLRLRKVKQTPLSYIAGEGCSQDLNPGSPAPEPLGPHLSRVDAAFQQGPERA